MLLLLFFCLYLAVFIQFILWDPSMLTKVALFYSFSVLNTTSFFETNKTYNCHSDFIHFFLILIKQYGRQKSEMAPKISNLCSTYRVDM